MINKLYLHRIGHRLSAAIIYGVLSAVAMNYFLGLEIYTPMG